MFRDQVLNQENISGIIIPDLTIFLLKLYRTISFISGYPLLQNFLISLIHHAQFRTCYKSSQNAKGQAPSKSKSKEVYRIFEKGSRESYPAEIACPLRNESSGSKYIWGEALHL